jgi:hypothetical protein
VLLVLVSLVVLVSLIAITFMITMGVVRVYVARRRARRPDHRDDAW